MADNEISDAIARAKFIYRVPTAQMKPELHPITERALSLTKAEALEIKRLFHQCWGNASSGDYNKRDWGELQLLLEKAGLL